VVVLYAIPGVAAEFAFDSRHIRNILAPAANVVHTKSAVTVTGLAPGLDGRIELTDDHGTRTTILLLTRDQAEQTTLLRIRTRDHLVMSASSLLFNGEQLDLRSTTSPTQSVSFLPDAFLA